ncbi:MAG: YfhO family protein, partial [Elusimicrobiota bacterium]
MANLQSMVFYPFSYLFVIFSFNSAVALFIVIHSMLAGMFAYLFFRRLGLDFLAAASGAVLWAFNGYFILHTYFLSNVAAYVWLPLVLLFFDYSITGNDIRFMPLTSLSLTIQFFGGYPLFSVITIIIMFFYGVIISAKDWSSLFNFFLKYILTLALFLLFSAVQLLPALELISNSVRAAGFAYETASVYSIHPLDFLKFLFLPLWNRVSPEISGDPSIIGFYFGWIAIILGTAGFTNKQLRKYVILFFVIFVISVLLSLGKYTPVHKWIYNTLPGFGLIRFAGQYIYTASFCATALVALGMAQIGGVKLKIVLFIILSVDLWLFSHYSIFTVSKDFYETLPENVEFLKKDNSHFRIYMTPRTRAQNIQPGKDIYGLWEKYRDSLYPNLSMAYGICDASGYEEL